MNRIIKVTMYSLILGLFFTAASFIVTRDRSYRVSICDAGHLIDFKVIKNLDVHYKIRGFPWPYIENDPEQPVTSNCPVNVQAVYQSPLSGTKAHFAEDWSVWAVISILPIILYLRKIQTKK